MTRNQCLERQRERERVGVKRRGNNSCHFSVLINIFFLVFYVNIQSSCPKTRMEYFSTKIKLLMKET